MVSRLAIAATTPRSASLKLGSSLREATGTAPVTTIVSQCAARAVSIEKAR